MSTEIKKKKLVIPAVTLLVAVAMMLGVGYAALTSTFEKTSSTTTGGEFSVTVEGSGTNSIFTNVKIPYAVITEDSTRTFTLESNYVLCEDKTVTITDDTGKYSSYTISVTASSTKLESLGSLTAEIMQSGDVASGTITSTSNLTLKVTFTPSSTTITEDGVAKLSADDIDIKITVTGVSSS